MDKEEERESSQSNWGQESDECSPKGKKARRNAKKAGSFPQERIQYTKQFRVHEKEDQYKKFPFDIYLENTYNDLNIEKKLNIIENYFGHGNGENIYNLEPGHIKILNEGLSILRKVPDCPILYVTINKYDDLNQMVTVKNEGGEIIHFGAIEKDWKRNRTLVKLKAKIKKRPFFIILDSNNDNKQKQQLTIESFSKIQNKFKFIYFKKISPQYQAQYFRAKFWDKNVQQLSPHTVFHTKLNLVFHINQSSQVFCVALDTQQESNNIYQFQSMLNRQLARIIQLQEEEQYIVEQYTSTHGTVRLRMFDAMLINYMKQSWTDKDKFITNIQKYSQKYINNKNLTISQMDHYPESIPNSKICKNCFILIQEKNQQKNQSLLVDSEKVNDILLSQDDRISEVQGKNERTKKKSKYRCIGCSLRFKQDIALCLTNCFGDFHEVTLLSIDPSLKNAKKMKENYWKNIKGKNSKLQKQTNSTVQQIDISKEQQLIGKKIIKLNSIIQEIDKNTQQLQQYQSGLSLVKMFTQHLFINVLKKYASLNEVEEPDRKHNLEEGMEKEGKFKHRGKTRLEKSM